MQSHLTEQQLGQFKKVLFKEREELLAQIDRHHRETSISSDPNLSSELAKYDNHFADMGTELFEQERDIAFYRAKQRHLSRLEDAIKRIDEHQYGVCNVCSQPIPIERLEAVPETATCEQHSPRIEEFRANYEYEPIKMEQISKDDMDYAAYDGEDTMRSLLQYGNSSYDEAITMLDTEFARELDDELEGFCEPIESFIATDITGNDVFIVRNHVYQRYIHSDEGDQELEQL
ncbi:hypothetical protein ACFP56_01820 [Paenibacillus septentrionalis]|uniref:Molecular chaperone DnaK n=1 Tax=Paenibacillus septentrionalis TaxID=429342 RepID=A0ABW1V115_9BACL